MKQTRYIKEIQQRRWVYRVLMLIIFIMVATSFCLVIFPLPKPSEIQSWLTDLRDYEQISKDQTKGMGEFNRIKADITKMNMAVTQVQKEEEIKGKINRLKNRKINPDGEIYSGFNIKAAGILQIYLESRQELGVVHEKNEKIRSGLEEVRSKMPEGGLSKSKHN